MPAFHQILNLDRNANALGAYSSHKSSRFNWDINIEVINMSEEHKETKQKQIEEELYKIFIKYIKKRSM